MSPHGLRIARNDNKQKRTAWASRADARRREPAMCSPPAAPLVPTSMRSVSFRRKLGRSSRVTIIRITPASRPTARTRVRRRRIGIAERSTNYQDERLWSALRAMRSPMRSAARSIAPCACGPRARARAEPDSSIRFTAHVTQSALPFRSACASTTRTLRIKRVCRASVANNRYSA